MEKIVHNGEVFGALLTDLSKASYCIPHMLNVSKLEPYGFKHLKTYSPVFLVK